MKFSNMYLLPLLAVTLAFALPATSQVNRPAKGTAAASTPSLNPPPPQTNLQTAQTAMSQVDPQPQITRSVQSASVETDILRGYKALQQNQFSQAREAYSQVLTRTPTQRDALLGIAYAHQALGSTAQALSTLRRLVDLYPLDSDAISALYLIGGGDVLAEETRFKQILERTERPAALHYALGVLYYDQNRFGDAERSFSRAFSMEPDQPDYAYNLALSLDRLGLGKDAAKQYVVALNLASQSSAMFSRDLARTRLKILTTTP